MVNVNKLKSMKKKKTATALKLCDISDTKTLGKKNSKVCFTYSLVAGGDEQFTST